MKYGTLICETDGPLATIRLNRPERMNAVIESMYEELRRAFGAFARDDANRCIVLTGSVLRRDGVDKQAFCAGADLKEHSAGRRGADERRRYIELAHATVQRIFSFPRPVIAAVNGPARGAGAELALACDFVLMADEATLGLPEVRLGTFVGGGLTHVLPRLVGLARAKELIYTGRVLDGQQAVRCGLALRSVPLSRLADEAHELAAELAAAAPLPLEQAKRFLNEAHATDMAAALRLETDAIVACMDTEDWHEGLRAFAERRAPRFRGR